MRPTSDVAVTTLFAHFARKEALVFQDDESFERHLVAAVTDRVRGAPLIPALRRQIEILVRHCSTDDVAPLWRMIDETPALRA